MAQASFKIKGWFFRTYDQSLGNEFAWGLSARSLWHEQIISLLWAAGLEQAIMYTVIPQPVAYSLQGTDATTMQVLVPFQYEPPNLLVLVVDHSFATPSTTVAILCHQPCTVYSVFVIIGLSKWCDLEHQCTATFRHGACTSSFHDLEQLRIPTASRIVQKTSSKMHTSEPDRKGLTCCKTNCGHVIADGRLQVSACFQECQESIDAHAETRRRS